MADDSSSTAIPDPVPNPSHVVVNVGPVFGRPGGHERLRRIKDALSRARVQFVAATGDIAKTLFTLACGGVLGIPAIFNAHVLPRSHLCLISILLLIGALSLILAIALRKIGATEPAGTSGLIGTGCVVTVLPIIATGVFPMLGFLAWVFVSLLVVFILCAVWVHPSSAQVVDENGIA